MTIPTLQNLESTALQIIVLFVVIFFLRVIVEIALNKAFDKYIKANLSNKSRAHKRFKTILEVVNNIAITITVVIAVFLILANFIDVRPILASAGILGLAISFGAQSLVKDFITGFFFLIKDQFGVGDTVFIGPPANITGKITELSLRTITIRDFSGNVTTLPNSTITIVTNMSKEWSLFDTIITYNLSVNIDEIIKYMKQAGEQIEADPDMEKMIIDKTQIIGVETLNDGKIAIRVNIKTLAGKQFDIGRRYKYNLKKLLEENNITTL